MNELLKVLTVFFACSIFFGKAGVPAAVVLFKEDFLKVFISSMAGGMFGNFIFTYASDAFLKWVQRYRAKRNLVHRRRIFTKFNRNVIRVKRRTGLAGIAFIAPMFLSLPLGTFLAEKFYRDKRKIIIYFTISEVFWTLALYLTIVYFHGRYNGWLT
jgi:hypothetical protein